MELNHLRAALEAAREFSAEAAGCRFNLRLPTDHAWRVTLEQHRDAAGQLLEARAFRALLEQAIRGWEGVTATLFVPDGGAEPVAYSPEALALLLEHRQDIADVLTLAMGARVAERRKAREALAKN
jgi:hypothetical protein